MSDAKEKWSTQTMRCDDAERDDASHREEPSREQYQLSRSSIAALSVITVAIAGLLVFVRWHAPQHSALFFLELLGFPVLILLAVILGRRRRAHA